MASACLSWCALRCCMIPSGARAYTLQPIRVWSSGLGGHHLPKGGAAGSVAQDPHAPPQQICHCFGHCRHQLFFRPFFKDSWRKRGLRGRTLLCYVRSGGDRASRTLRLCSVHLVLAVVVVNKVTGSRKLPVILDSKDEKVQIHLQQGRRWSQGWGQEQGRAWAGTASEPCRASHVTQAIRLPRASTQTVHWVCPHAPTRLCNGM